MCNSKRFAEAVMGTLWILATRDDVSYPRQGKAGAIRGQMASIGPALSSQALIAKGMSLSSGQYAVIVKGASPL